MISKIKTFSSYLLFLTILSFGCKKSPKPPLSSIDISVSANTNQFSSNISGVDEANIIEVGFVWSAAENPDKLNSFIYSSKASLAFSYIVMSGLTDQSTYYVRGYYIDKDNMIHYSASKSFKAKGTSGLEINPNDMLYTWDDEAEVTLSTTQTIDLAGVNIKINKSIQVIPTRVNGNKVYFKVPRSLTKAQNTIVVEQFGQESSASTFNLAQPQFPDKIKFSGYDNKTLKITGKNFNPEKDKNIVTIGGKKVEVISANKSELEVKILVPSLSFISKISISTGEGLAAETSEFSKFYKHFIDIDTFPGLPRVNGIALEANGNIYCGFGYGDELKYKKYNDLYEYNPAALTWKKMANFPEDIFSKLGVTINHKLYVTAQSQISSEWRTNHMYMFDPNTNNWSKKASFEGTRLNDETAFSDGNYGYTIGGWYVDQHQQKTSNRVMRYDAINDSWKQLPDFPGTNSISIPPVVKIGRKIYILRRPDSWVFDLETEKWTRIGGIPDNMGTFGFAFSLNGKGYIGGGGLNNGAATSLVFEYNPSGNTYTIIEDAIDPIISGSQAIVADNKAYILFGRSRTKDSYASKSFFQFVP